MNLLRIHRKYLFNKVNIIITFVVIFICLVTNLVNVKTLTDRTNWFYQHDSINLYLNNNLIVYRLIIVSFICFIFGNSFSIENDNYHQLYNNFHKKKILFFISKFSYLLSFSFFMVLLMFLNTNILGIIGTSFYQVDNSVILLFVNLFLILSIYGILSIIVSLLIPTNSAYFIPMGLFVLGEIIKDSFSTSQFVKIYELLFPSLMDTTPYNPYGIIHLMFLLIGYSYIATIIYLFHYRD